jgi:hypothetical protein
MQRVLNKQYTERDVQDVESYVRETVGQISPYIASDEREQLVARGIVLVRRIARALPPESSLDRVLQDRLGTALTVYRWRGVRLETARAPLAPTRAA